MPINGITAYLVGGTLAVLFGVMSYQWVINSKLELNLAKCHATNERLSADSIVSGMEVDSLEAIIDVQNREIRRAREAGEEFERNALEVQDRAAKAKEKKLQAIADLAREQGASCEEGIELIDRELGL